MFLMILPLLLLLSLWIVWKFYCGEKAALANWRRRLFLIGIILNAVSIAALLIFLIHAYVVAHSTRPLDLDRMYPVLSMFGFGLLTSVLAAFGRRVSRFILIIDGLITSVLWYLAALAASP
jgi:hypothetical protein